MKYNEIMALLDKGFTPEYIMGMGEVDNNIEDVNHQQSEQEQQEPPESQEPQNNYNEQFQQMMETFTNQMNKVVKEIQASNILASQQETVKKSADPAVDALAHLLMPPGLADK